MHTKRLLSALITSGGRIVGYTSALRLSPLMMALICHHPDAEKLLSEEQISGEDQKWPKFFFKRQVGKDVRGLMHL